MPAAPPLPFELIELIISGLTDQKDILRCALISKVWLAPCRAHHVLSTIRAPNTDTRFSALRTIVSSPHCSLHLTRVREIEIQGELTPALGRFVSILEGSEGSRRKSESASIEWNIFLRHLECLSVKSVLFPAVAGKHVIGHFARTRRFNTLITPPFHFVHTLCLNRVSFALPAQFAEFLSSFTRLETLICDRLNVTFTPFAPAVDLTRQLCLRTLHLTGFSSLVSLWDCNLYCPNLREFKFRDDDELEIGSVLRCLSCFLESSRRIRSFDLSLNGFHLSDPPTSFDLSTILPRLTELSLDADIEQILAILIMFTKPRRTLRYARFQIHGYPSLNQWTILQSLLRINAPRLEMVEAAFMDPVCDPDDETEIWDQVINGLSWYASRGLLKVIFSGLHGYK
ncbi:hypothetical protein VNI00_010306 [Paramarasmius palmivorus]|uniref:F-box domain-containing protein n=1 Tax=Paramarasmius palmivorus TaxID=297713 RepID=A0AAW0CME2_9AGAR